MNSVARALRVLLARHFLLASLLGSLATMAIILAPIAHMIVKYGISVEFLTRPLAYGMLVLSFGYGVLRGWLYHPVFDAGYSKWLANTPWTPRQPLPKGPVHLVWSDLIVVGVLAASSYLLALTIAPPIWPFAVGPIVLFAAGIAVVWTLALVAVGQRSHVYAVLAVPVLFAMLQIQLTGFLFCPLVMAGIAELGIRRSLATFPWLDHDLATVHARESQRSSSFVGWPYRDLLHAAEEFRTTAWRAIMEAAVAGGWAWFLIRAVNEGDPQEDLSGVMAMTALGAIIGGGVRLAKYGPVICENLCWGQRVANKQWLIPRHDQIFLVPLLMVIVGWALPWILHHGIGMSIAVSCGITVSAVVLLARGMGPSIQELQWTGVHSKFGTLGQSKEFITIRGSNS